MQGKTASDLAADALSHLAFCSAALFKEEKSNVLIPLTNVEEEILETAKNPHAEGQANQTKAPCDC